ncbi:MAG TPA: lamin tail domain-containing protein, partial [Flavisolibacter sp.]|nr:lamin tail domain-containing protein [Flavisolibacter sp.]
MQRLPILLFFSVLARAGFSQIVINEIGIAPPGVPGSEFIELYNRSGCTVDLSCYTLVFSSTSGSGNPTGWTIKIPTGKTIAAGGYFLIGGTAGAAGVSGGTGYPTGGSVNSYPGIADVDVGTIAITANAVYMKQAIGAGSLPNTGGQLSLVDASGRFVWSVSYNNGNNPGTYPLSAYTTCNASGNTQGINNISNPGVSVNNVNGIFTASTNQGIYLNSVGSYQTETTLSPRVSNTLNGGTQICSGPVLVSVSNVVACVGLNNQTVSLPFTASNSPVTYSISWNPVPANVFPLVVNAIIGSNILITIPANTAANIYTGYLTVTNTCGTSCTLPFTLTINAKPVVTAGTYGGSCINSAPVVLTGSPAGGVFSGFAVSGGLFVPPSVQGSYSISYSYTDLGTGCSNAASTIISVSAPASSYTTACTNTVPYLFSEQL